MHAGVPPSWARKSDEAPDPAALLAQYYGDVGALDLSSIRTWRRKYLHDSKSKRKPFYGSFSKTRCVRAWLDSA